MDCVVPDDAALPALLDQFVTSHHRPIDAGQRDQHLHDPGLDDNRLAIATDFMRRRVYFGADLEWRFEPDQRAQAYSGPPATGITGIYAGAKGMPG